jgi:arsenate reductase-like glutaredoxin family protein
MSKINTLGKGVYLCILISKDITMRKELTVKELTMLLTHYNNRENRIFEEKRKLFNKLKVSTSLEHKEIKNKKEYYLIVNHETLIEMPISKNTVDTLLLLASSKGKKERENIFTSFHFDETAFLPDFIYVKAE